MTDKQPNEASSSLPDYSPASTTVAFDPTLPALRIPIAAVEGEDAGLGPHRLVFEDETSLRKAWMNTERRIAVKCKAGARMGCSISAARSCRPFRFRGIFLRPGGVDEGGRAECEERHMAGCLAEAEASCSDHAREICEPVFSNMGLINPGRPSLLPPPPASRLPPNAPASSAASKALSQTPPEARDPWAPQAQAVAQSRQHEGSSGGAPGEGHRGWEGGLIRPSKDPKPRHVYQEQHLQNMEKAGVLSRTVSSLLPDPVSVGSSSQGNPGPDNHDVVGQLFAKVLAKFASVLPK